MNKTTRLLFFFLFFTVLQLIAQSQPQIEMADDFRGEGKNICSYNGGPSHFRGNFLTLFWFDRRLSQLEKQIADKK